MKVIYIAGKYRGQYPYQIKQNVIKADVFGMKVCELGAMPLIPHCNTFGYEGLQDDEFFLEGTMELMRRCDAILLIPGWEQSQGATGEKKEAEARGLPVFQSIEELTDWLKEE